MAWPFTPIGGNAVSRGKMFIFIYNCQKCKKQAKMNYRADVVIGYYFWKKKNER